MASIECHATNMKDNAVCMVVPEENGNLVIPAAIVLTAANALQVIKRQQVDAARYHV